MIDSLIKKELNELNIVWIPSNSKHFEKLFDSLGFNYFDLSDLFTGLCTPNLIITNNRFSKFDIVINLCLTNHCNLIIIDPKRREQATSEGIPHLLCPVITEAKKATAALGWTVKEM